MSNYYDDRERQFNEYLRDGITAVKNGQKKLARSLLNRATYLNSADARPYVWLAANTDDPREKMELLERAVALEPSNMSARRGLALLKGKIDPQQLLPMDAETEKGTRGGIVEAEGGAFDCPSCGGRLKYDILTDRVTCEYCGFEESGRLGGNPEPPIEQGEQVLDFVIPTTQGHHWAQAQQQLKCGQCGALSLLPPGEATTQCAYCGSHQWVQSEEQNEVLDPHGIVMMKIDETHAKQAAQRWLGKGVFAPDNLIQAALGLRLRPAYYSCWIFDGTVEVRWSCEVAIGDGKSERWLPSSGVEAKFFKDVLVPGVRALSTRELEAVGPFNLDEAQDFDPQALAGWLAILYDRSLADASLLAREIVIQKFRPQLHHQVEMGREKRNLQIGGGSWSGMTFKHLLLPMWAGIYRFQGKEYRLLVNGQSGKTAGEKPRDSFKLVFAILSFFLLLLLLGLLVWVLTTSGGAG